MCVKSQFPSICDLFGGFIPHGKYGVIVILRGYIDESYNDRLFTLSCVMSDPVGWTDIQRGWRLCLKAKNKALRSQGRPLLSRYHAADCSSLVGEFLGWRVDEQISFTKELHAALRRGRGWLNTIAYSIPLADFVEHFPERAEDPIASCQREMLKFLMLEVSAQIKKAKRVKRSTRPVSIILIHERCAYDGIMLSAFNQMLEDQTFSGRDMFTTIAPMGWEKCLPLQVADMIAYETFKDAERRSSGRQRRKSLEALLSAGQFGGRSKIMSAENIQQWRALIDNASHSQLSV